jgi:hypothetical protein
VGDSGFKERSFLQVSDYLLVFGHDERFLEAGKIIIREPEGKKKGSKKGGQRFRGKTRPPEKETKLLFL